MKYHQNVYFCEFNDIIVELLQQYFPTLTPIQLQKFGKLQSLYENWNAKINVVSRKDIEFLYERHVLHSLGIAKILCFKPGAFILDVGTGGGFPGIPLSIFFPETSFHLIDTISKKIKVVNEVARELKLENVLAEQKRAGTFEGRYDFIVSRAVTNMPDFVKWVRKNTKKQSKHTLVNGILYLKGGDLSEELAPFPKATQYDLSNFFNEKFYETKKVVHVPVKYKP